MCRSFGWGTVASLTGCLLIDLAFQLDPSVQRGKLDQPVIHYVLLPFQARH